jgi:phosphotransferase system, enzyme I, PtsP
MAGCHGPVKLLFPMISGVDEVAACRRVVEEAKQNLLREGLPCCNDLPLGVMIEVPAAVQMIAQLAAVVDFFALGTNDLVQYLLAADRNNPLVNKYYDPLHPAVLRVIRQVVDAARAARTGLCLCGEMASDPLNLLVLIGLGIREFSMPAPFIPRTKAFLRDLDGQVAAAAAERVLRMNSGAEIRAHLIDILKQLESR